MSINLTMRS